MCVCVSVCDAFFDFSHFLDFCVRGGVEVDFFSTFNTKNGGGKTGNFLGVFGTGEKKV